MSRRLNPTREEKPGFLETPWPWIAAIAGYLAFLFRDILFGGRVFFFRDHLMVYLPRDASFRAAISEGALPLWDPLFLGGQPFAANPGRQVFYPPHFLVLIGDLSTGYGLFLFFHLIVGALGMFALVRFAGGSNVAATLGAATLVLGGPFLSSLHLLPTLSAVSWMPWIARFTEGFLRSRRPLEFLGAALMLGLLALGGDPVQAPITGALLLGWCVARQRLDDRREAMRAALGDAIRVGAIGVSALLLAAVQLWPAFDFARDTVRSEKLSFEMVSHWSLPPARALEVFFPRVFDVIAPGRLYAESGGVPLLVSVYLGFATCVLALAAFAVRQRWAGWLAAVTVVMGILAVGSHTPLLRALYDSGLLPSLRYPEKLILPVALLIVLWSALTFDRLREGDRVLTRWVLAAGGAWIVVALMLMLARGSIDPGSTAKAYWLKIIVVGVVTMALLWTVSRSRKLLPAILLVAFVAAVDLGTNARGWTPAMPGALLEPPAITSTLDTDKESYRILNDAALQFMDYGDPEGKAWFKAIDLLLHRNAMFPMSNGIWGYSSVLEWDTEHTELLPTKRFQDAMYEVRESGQTRWLSMFTSMSNARYTTAFRSIRSAQLDARGDALAIRPVDFIRVGEAPRFSFATSLRRLTSPEDFVSALKQGEWEEGVAWVDLEPFAPAAGEVLEVDESRHDVTLRVRADGRAYLNVAITPHRYWSAAIDGSPATLHVTNLGFQGLELPAGEHTIELRYRNPVIVLALITSLLTLIGLAAGAIVMEKRGRR